MTDSDRAAASDPGPVLEGDVVDPVPARLIEVQAEIIDADVVDDELVPEYVVVAEPALDSADALDPVPPRSDVDPGTVHDGRPGRHRQTRRPARPPEADRRPGLPSRPWLAPPLVVLLALAGAFFARVSAEPFWLSVGHGQSGTAVVVASAGGCRATFVGPEFTRSTVELAGAPSCAVGASMPARMVSADAARAYAAGQAGLVPRWSVGYALVLLCGLLVARVTRARSGRGWAVSLVAPLAVAAALLAAAY